MRRDARIMLAGLLTLLTAQAASGQEAGGLKGTLDAVARDQAEARRRFTKDLEGKTTEEEQKPAVDRFHEDVARNTGRVLDLVRANPGDPSAVEALKFVIQTARGGPGDESYRAMELLLRDHVRDPGLGNLCGGLFVFVHAPVAESLLRAVLEKHPDRVDRGLACHALSFYLRMKARMVRRSREDPAQIDRYVGPRHAEATRRLVKEADLAALDREAEALLERVIAEFADLKNGSEERPMGVVAEGELFAMRNLAVGKVAPEIVGGDHEGRPFSSGDYRGRVVVLTFSGNWCGPCVGMYPQERELVSRLKDRPFALLSVNTDEDSSTLRKSITSGEISWRCWWDGGTGGPITTRWGVSSFPSIFVLDRAGVIRFKDLRGDALEKAVTSLLDEAPAGTGPAR